MARVSGKVAIVTGGARGIGAAVARKLVAEGAKILIVDILDELGGAVARELGDHARFHHHDVAQADGWGAAVVAAEKAFGPVNVLVNDAGINGVVGSTETLSEADFRHVLDVNLVSVFLGMQAVVPSMRRAGGGSIINLSSLAGIVTGRGLAAYTASKFGVRGITKTAALDFAPYGIRVNSIHPGFIETPMTADMVPKDPEEAAKFKRNCSPAGRMGQPEEIANVILMLASDEVRFATGAEFVIDGGLNCC